MGHKPFAYEKGPSFRSARFAERLKEELSGIIPTEIKDPRLDEIYSLTVTNVEVAQDCKNATVFFSLSEDEEKQAPRVINVLIKATNFIRRELSFALGTKVTPQLTFKLDKGIRNVETIDTLLKQISEDEDGEK